MKPSRCLLSWLLVVLVAPILIACGAPAVDNTSAGTGTNAAPAAPAAESAPDTNGAAASAVEKVLRIHAPHKPTILDPQRSSGISEISVLALNYEGLTRQDQSGKLIPAAAEKWEFNATGDSITFTLRPGLSYSDGAPVTAENFRYAVERTCDSATAGDYQSILFEISGCQELASTPVTDTAKYARAKQQLGAKALDERTLQIDLTRAAPYYATIAGLWVFYPARQDLIAKGGAEWWRDPASQIGNGPFQIVEYTEQRATFKANQRYWTKPKLDTIVYNYSENSAAGLAAYKAGDIDIMLFSDPGQLPEARNDPQLSKEMVSFPNASTSYLNFALDKAPFTDKKVREAFAYALDRAAYCEQMRKGDCISALSWMPPGVPGAIETKQYDFDPEKARQALAASSYGGPAGLPEIKLTYSNDDPANQPLMDWVAKQIRDVLAVDVKLNPLPAKELSPLRRNPETNPQIYAFDGWYQDYPDPQNWLSIYWTCESVFAVRKGYCNQDFDDLIHDGDAELDTEKRLKIYQAAGQMLVDDVPGVFMYHRINIFLVKPYVSGYSSSPSDYEWPGQYTSAATIDVQRRSY